MERLLLFSLVCSILIGCSAPKHTIKENGTVTLKIVQINDVYEISPLNGGAYGGLARVAHIRDSIKEKFPNTYLFLAGDFLSPSLMGTLKIDGERLNGKQMVEVLNAMDIDLVTFGNHEFDLNEPDLQKRMDESNFSWTSANTRRVTEGGNVPFGSRRNGKIIPVSDFEIFKVEGPSNEKLAFGVFGVTVPSNPRDYVYYADIFHEADRAYRLALQKSDFVLGLTHVALEEDREIAGRLPSLPLIMGGHEHFNMLEREGATIIAKADANAKSVYVHTLVYNTREKDLFVSSDLVMVTEKTGSSAKVAQVVKKWTDLMDTKLKEVIDNPDEIVYHATVPLDGTDDASRSQQTNLGELIAQSMAHAYKDQAKAAIVNGGSIRIDDKLSGDISSTDIFRVLPFGGSVLLVDLKGALLKQVLDFGMQQIGTGAYLQRHNISQNQFGEWQIGSKKIEDQETYSVAFSDFLLKGLDIPFLTPENPGILKIYYPRENEIAGDIRRATINYLKAQQE